MNDKKIIICVPTYLRPIYLEKNLNSLIQQDCNYTYEITVVDNDINQSAKPIVDKFNNSKIKCSYYIENTRGISAVRNKCIEVCKEKNADYLVFIDDDEIAEKNWLQSLLDTSQKYNAEVVSGPVLCKFEKKPGNAIQKVFFTRRRLKTGSIIENCASGNVLIDMKIFKEKPHLLFNKNFNLRGGGDTHFFIEVKSYGFNILWCDEAILHEFISRERSNLKNSLLRSFFAGNQLFYIKKITNKNIFNLKNSSVLKTFLNIIVIIIRLIFYFLTLNKYKFIKNLSRISEKLGFIITALTGIEGRKYKKIFGE